MSKVIDFHIHVADLNGMFREALEFALRFKATNRFEEILGPEGRMMPDRLLRILDESGVDFGVIIPSPFNIENSNNFVIDFCSNEPRLIPFVVINPNNLPNAAEELIFWVTKKGARGLKLFPSYHHYYPNDPALYPLYKVAEELKIPVMFHTGSSLFRVARIKYADPIFLDDVALDFPDLKIIMAHSGRGFWYDRAVFLSKIRHNLFMEISGLPPKKLGEYFTSLEEVASKVIFGTDWPEVPSIKANVEEFRQLSLSEEAKERILWHNAASLLGLETSG